MIYTGRTRRRWFFWTQHEYQFRAFVGGKWQNPWNVDEWPICLGWTYHRPSP